MPLRWSLGKIAGQFYKYAAPMALVFSLNLLGAPASRRPVVSRKPEHAGETPALPGVVPRFTGSKRALIGGNLFLKRRVPVYSSPLPDSALRSQRRGARSGRLVSTLA
jgi:hypothetical protein